jgi:hypothetical protein
MATSQFPATQNVSFEHNFTEEEMRGLAESMAAQEKKVADLEAEKKKAADNFKLQVDSAKLALATAAMKYRDGHETRYVDAKVRPDFTTGKVLFIHPETGQVLRERIMTEDEKQIKLPLDIGGAGIVHSVSDAQDRREARQ